MIQLQAENSLFILKNIVMKKFLIVGSQSEALVNAISKAIGSDKVEIYCACDYSDVVKIRKQCGNIDLIIFDAYDIDAIRHNFGVLRATRIAFDDVFTVIVTDCAQLNKSLHDCIVRKKDAIDFIEEWFTEVLEQNCSPKD